MVGPSGKAKQAYVNLYSYRNCGSGLKRNHLGEIKKEFLLVTDPEAANWQRQTILSELNDLAKNGEIML